MTAITDGTRPISATFTPRIGMEARMPSRPGLREAGRPENLVGGRARFQGERPGLARSTAGQFDDAIVSGDIWIARADHVAQWWRDQHGE